MHGQVLSTFSVTISIKHRQSMRKRKLWNPPLYSDRVQHGFNNRSWIWHAHQVPKQITSVCKQSGREFLDAQFITSEIKCLDKHQNPACNSEPNLTPLRAFMVTPSTKWRRRHDSQIKHTYIAFVTVVLSHLTRLANTLLQPSSLHFRIGKGDRWQN